MRLYFVTPPTLRIDRVQFKLTGVLPSDTAEAGLVHMVGLVLMAGCAKRLQVRMIEAIAAFFDRHYVIHFFSRHAIADIVSFTDRMFVDVAITASSPYVVIATLC